MKQFRWLAALMVGAMVLAACGEMQAAVPDTDLARSSQANVFEWDGVRGTDSERCQLVGQNDRPEEGWIHWVFSTKGESTGAVLTLGGTGSGAYSPGAPLNANVWHFYTPYFKLEGLTASIELLGGAAGTGGELVISDYCPGEPVDLLGSLLVSKTVETSYNRVHDWSIEKSVDPDTVYLFVDGSGDTTVEWTIDVTYEGYEDRDIEVSGTISILNNGDFAALIDDVTDVLSFIDEPDVAADVNCDVTFPYTLAVGDTLTCDYEAELDEVIDGVNTATVVGTFPAWLDDTEQPIDIDAFVEEDVNFGDPDHEVNKTVAVKDISDLFGPVDLGTVTAPNGDSFTYDDHFAYAADLECGEFTYDNTAQIIGDDGEVIDEADATLTVDVQCLVFDGETAWAANGLDPGELRYNTRGGNWATYVKYAVKTTTLFAGQTIPVGTVSFSAVEDEEIVITVVMTAPWEFEDVAENLKVQDYASKPSGNPSPGLFDHKQDCDPDENTCSITVPENKFYGVHVNVGQWVPDPDFGL